MSVQAALRKKILKIRKAQSPELLDQSSKNIFHRFIKEFSDLGPLRSSLKIALFRAMPGEVRTQELAETLTERGATLYYPQVSGLEMKMVRPASGIFSWQMSDLGFEDLRTLSGDLETVDPHNIDVVFVPGVVFDHQGNRVGRGKGFYDRYLSQSQFLTISFAFDFQLVEAITPQDWDQPVDWVLTETQSLKRASFSSKVARILAQ